MVDSPITAHIAQFALSQRPVILRTLRAAKGTKDPQLLLQLLFRISCGRVATVLRVPPVPRIWGPGMPPRLLGGSRGLQAPECLNSLRRLEASTIHSSPRAVILRTLRAAKGTKDPQLLLQLLFRISCGPVLAGNRQARSHTNSAQIAPSWIDCLDEGDFPGSSPALQSLLSIDRCPYVLMPGAPSKLCLGGTSQSAYPT
jgi:hypothetical protein